jgi:hypothetical protein
LSAGEPCRSPVPSGAVEAIDVFPFFCVANATTEGGAGRAFGLDWSTIFLTQDFTNGMCRWWWWWWRRRSPHEDEKGRCEKRDGLLIKDDKKGRKKQRKQKREKREKRGKEEIPQRATQKVA